MSRLIKKFLGPDSVDGSKIKLLNNEALKAASSSGMGNVEILKVNASDIPEFLVLPVVTADPTSQNEVVRKKYVDDQISSLVNGAPELLNTLKELADALGSDADWATSVASQIAGIKDRLDVLEGDVSVAGSFRKGDADTLQAAKDYADAIESGLDSRLDAIESSGASAADLTALEGRVDTLESDVSTLKGDATVEGSVAKAAADALASAQSYADNIESQLDSRIDALEADATTASAVAQALQDAKDYSDQKDAVQDGRLDVLEGDATVAGSVAKAQADAQDFATALDTAMGARVSSLEALGFIKEKKLIGATEAMQGYVDLAHEAKAYSTFVFVQGGLYLYEGDDYTLSNVGGVTRVTLAGEFASGGATAIADGDVLCIQYQYQSSGGGGGGGNSGGQSPTLDLMSAMESGTDYAIYWNATNASGLYVAVVNDGPGWSMAAMAGAADQGYANVNKGLLTNGNSYRIRLYTDSSYTTPVDPSVISATAFTAAISPPFDHTTASGTLSDVSINGSYDLITFSVSGLSTLPAGWRWEIADSSDPTGSPLDGSTTVGSGPAQTYPLMFAIPEGGTKYLVLGVREFLSTGTFYPKAVSPALSRPAAPQYNVDGTGVDQTGVVTVVGWASQVRIKGATDPNSPVLNPVTYPNAQWKWLNLTGMYPARQAGITTQPSDAEITAWINNGTVPAGLTETSETIGYAMNQGGSVGPANLEYGPNYRAGEVIRVTVGGASVYIKFIG